MASAKPNLHDKMPSVKRLRRLTWNWMTIVSAMLGLALVALWIRSYSVHDMHDRWFIRHDSAAVSTFGCDVIRAADGEVGFVHFEQRYGPGPVDAEYRSADLLWRDVQPRSGSWTTAPPRLPYGYWESSLSGFRYHDDWSAVTPGRPRVRDRLLVIPYWFMVAATGLIPALWLYSTIRARVPGSETCRPAHHVDMIVALRPINAPNAARHRRRRER